MSDLTKKIEFLSKPASHGGRQERIDTRETHMSWVFFTEREAFKLKKPVKYPFLDFSTIEKRRFFCEEELRLNSRLAADTYKAVMPLYEGAEGMLSFSGPGRIVDWLVRMNRLPATRMMDVLIAEGRLSKAEVGRVADVLCDFYRVRSGEPLTDGIYLDNLSKEQAINRDILRRPGLGLADLAGPILDAADEALARVAPEIVDRAMRGLIVEGHGDLRPEHICLTEPIQIFDCLEFNRTLRIVDPYDELNYLGLECAMAGAGWVGALLLDRAGRQLGHRPGQGLIALYGVLRALLRARLSASRVLEDAVREREKWIPLARRYLARGEDACVSLRRPEVRRSRCSRSDA